MAVRLRIFLSLFQGHLLHHTLIDWCRDAMENFAFSPVNLTVKLLNEEHQPLLTWNVFHAYPVKWAVEDFNAEESKLSVETLELAYNYYTTLKNA